MSDKMNDPLVSLLFCTRNRAEQLRPCLDHIAALETQIPWELVVVDNGSTDQTRAILDDFKTKASFPVTIVYEGQPGKSVGLNRALPFLRGPLIALIDDDCYVAPDYIDRVQEIFDDPRIGFAGGRVDLFDPTDAPLTIRTETETTYLPPRSFVEPGFIPGCNMMIRRDILASLGGFDPDFGPGRPIQAAQDLELIPRASFAGWWGIYAPSARVAHHHRRKPGAGFDLHRRYSIGIGAYLVKYTLARDTRNTFAKMWLRRWYWWLRQALRGGNGLMIIGWEAKGAARYLALRLRRAAGGPLGTQFPRKDRRSEKAS